MMENGPILKKVRRPINRMMPVSSTEPTSEMIEDNQSNINSGPNDLQLKDNLSSKAEVNVAPVNLPSVERAPIQSQQENYNYDEPQYADEAYYNDYAPMKSNGVSTTVLIVSILVCLAIGLFLGKLLSGESQVTHSGLQGVVVNNEVPRGRARCGVADRSQGCVLYIMNPQRQNVRAKDFYDMAAQVTGRQRFMIETGNMRYANTEIRPGDIAQLNIPPL